MQNTGQSQIELRAAEFTRQAREQSGVNFDRCYQCLTCTLSCPAAFTMDYLPHQIIRKVQMGARKEVLSSRTIWRCVACETCVTRCPQEINLPHLMDTLRQMALEERAVTGDKVIPVFHQVFLQGVRRWGRQYELGLLLSFKIKTKDLFSDIGLGLKMLQKRKLSLLPGRERGRPEMKKLRETLK
jgi:heterodisulfide reductase subunit C2